MTRLIAIIFVLILGFAGIVLGPSHARGEWYVGGFGGVSTAGSIHNATMPNLGQTIAFQRYHFNPNIPNGDSLTQSFNTSDISLKSSPLFGGKAGYFFVDEGLPWLGVEVEAYTSKPSIKRQTPNFTQQITSIKGTPGVAPCLPPPAANCSMQETLTGQLSIGESPLRVVTVALNVVTRYPGKVFQPYIGVGVGAFYFTSSSGPIQGRQVVPGLNALAGMKVFLTDEMGLFLEGKYNYATLTNFDPTFGLSGEFSAINFIVGAAYHF